MKVDTNAVNVLTDLLRENNVYLGGSALGKGFRRAARWHLQQHAAADRTKKAFTSWTLESLCLNTISGACTFHESRVTMPSKCNPDPLVIQTLAILGANFDCASQEEISLVQRSSTTCRDNPKLSMPILARLVRIFAMPLNGVSRS